jgi:hypothetical protein
MTSLGTSTSSSLSEIISQTIFRSPMILETSLQKEIDSLSIGTPILARLSLRAPFPLYFVRAPKSDRP